LNSLSGKKPVVICFYLKNFTLGCIKEVCDFRDGYKDLKALDTEVITISSGSKASHERFKSR